MSAQGGAFGKVLEGDEVERFLARFVAPEGGEPQNVQAVLQDVRGIWEQKGFLTPAELQAELIQKYLPENTDPQVRAFIRQAELSRNAPEATTGYLGKEHAYLATGLAHFYAQDTGQPMTMIEADFSNMGGTNEHFKKLYPGIGQKGAEAMTDAAVLLLSQSVTSDLRDLLPEGAKIVPIRTGGDELRIMVTGLSGDARMKEITDTLHAGIEKHVAAMGLQDHPHLKAPDDPVRNGFGIALAMQDMRQIASPETLIQELDARIKVTKDEIGLIRLGRVDEEFVRLEAESRLDNGFDSLPPGMSREAFLDAQVAQARDSARVTAEALHNINPMHNPGLDGTAAGFAAYVKESLVQQGPGPLPVTAAPAVLGAAEKTLPEGVPALATMDGRRMALAESHFAVQGVELDSTQRRLLGMTVEGLSPRDPSAQTMMPHDMPPTAEAWAREAGGARPQAMAVSFHNLAGLNGMLGHHNADVVLRHMGQEVVGKSLEAAGVPRGDYIVAHHGGANFSVLMKPGVSEDMLKQAQDGIQKRVIELNGANVTDFLKARGAEVAEGTVPATFADIEDPKARSVTVNGQVHTGRVNGLHVVSVVQAVGPGGLNGNAFIGGLRSQADARMNGLRDGILERQVQPAAPAASSRFVTGTVEPQQPQASRFFPAAAAAAALAEDKPKPARPAAPAQTTMRM